MDAKQPQINSAIEMTPVEQVSANMPEVSQEEYLHKLWSGELGVKLRGFAAMLYGENGEHYADYHPDYVKPELAQPALPVTEEIPAVDNYEAAVEQKARRPRHSTPYRIGRLVAKAAIVPAVFFGSIMISDARMDDGQAMEVVTTTTDAKDDYTEDTTIPTTTITETATTVAPTTEAATTTTTEASTATTVPETTTTVPATTTAVPETATTVEPSPQQRALQSVLSGERSLVEIAGADARVANFSIDSIGLTGVEVFVSNELPKPTEGPLLEAYDYNNDGVIGSYRDEYGRKIDENAEYQADNGNPLYYLVSDPTPDAPFDPANIHAAGMRQNLSYYQSRSERESRGSLDAWNDAEGTTASSYLPIAVLDSNGALPGENGNAVIFGHRTTESAPFASLDMLQDGAIIPVTRVDGQTFNYQVVGHEVVNTVGRENEAQQEILNYTGPNGETATMTLYACEPQGSSDFRLVYRLVLVP